MINSYVENIKIIAQGLGELNAEVIFVGGAVTEFYSTFPGASDMRVTLDIDCVIKISTRKDFQELEEKLRSKGFEHEISEGAPICRWRYKSVLVDIMPTNEEILGFTNRWYMAGMGNIKLYPLSKSLNIKLFQAEFFLASKIEAFKNRGGDDLRQSHDFEDIIYLLENDASIVTRIEESNSEIKNFLIKEFTNLLGRDDLLEGIECALSYGSESDSSKMILDTMKRITNSK